HRVGLHHVASNLPSPLGRPGISHSVHFMLGIEALNFGKSRSKDGHRARTVLVLAALALTLHHNAGWQMGDSDGAFRFVDMLPTGAAGAQSFHLEIVGINLDLILFDFREHTDLRE